MEIITVLLYSTVVLWYLWMQLALEKMAAIYLAAIGHPICFREHGISMWSRSAPAPERTHSVYFLWNRSEGRPLFLTHSHLTESSFLAHPRRQRESILHLQGNLNRNSVAADSPWPWTGPNRSLQSWSSSLWSVTSWTGSLGITWRIWTSLSWRSEYGEVSFNC